jgi:hypothetical protein
MAGQRLFNERHWARVSEFLIIAAKHPAHCHLTMKCLRHIIICFHIFALFPVDLFWRAHKPVDLPLKKSMICPLPPLNGSVSVHQTIRVTRSCLGAPTGISDSQQMRH